MKADRNDVLTALQKQVSVFSASFTQSSSDGTCWTWTNPVVDMMGNSLQIAEDKVILKVVYSLDRVEKVEYTFDEFLEYLTQRKNR